MTKFVDALRWRGDELERLRLVGGGGTPQVGVRRGHIVPE